MAELKPVDYLRNWMQQKDTNEGANQCVNYDNAMTF